MDATDERSNMDGPAPPSPEPAVAETVAENVAATDAARSLGDLLNRVMYGGQSFVITRHGRPVAELVPAQAA